MTKITQSDLAKLSENLLKEAIEALKYGLKFNCDYNENHETGLLKQSIMNFHRFIELTLKHFIASINPLLIFEKPFDENFNLENPKTISFTQALNFYCHNAELGILSSPQDFNKKEFKATLCLLRNLRNDVAHLFLSENDDEKLQAIFSENVRLIYLVFIEQNIHQKIEERLTPDENDMLNELIDIEKEKLKKKLALALERVEEYTVSRSSLDPKDYNPNEAPVFDCPSCANQTFILSQDDKLFYCTYCLEEESADICSGPFDCATGLIPDCYLMTWDEEHGSKICESCHDEYESRVRSD